MEPIKYMLKPEWVTWNSIHECLVQGHQTDAQLGFQIATSRWSVDELKKYMEDAYCFVALMGDKVIGMNALKIKKIRMWYAKEFGYECLTAVVPEYRNTGAYFGLRKIRTEYAKKLGVKVLQFSTHEANKNIQMIDLKFGFKYVRYSAISGTDYYSVVMAKWLDGCPYSDWYCNFRFQLSKFLTRLVFKPGRKFRFWF